MTEIIKFEIPIDSPPLPDNLGKKIEYILNEFSSYCGFKNSPVVNVREENHWMRGDPPPKDTVSNIPEPALGKFIPGTSFLERPYNNIMRKIFFHKKAGCGMAEHYDGFLIATYDIKSIQNHSALESYDNMKYNTILQGMKAHTPLVWLELICVEEDSRKKKNFRKINRFS